MFKTRIALAILTLSASAIVGISTYEGYTSSAIIPVPGDVPTIGFGATKGVKLGDKTTPQRALARLLIDATEHSEGIKKCISVPLYQTEFDAYSSLSYNIGTKAFCGSTLAKKLNAGDYAGACQQIKRWNRFKGKPLPGLTARREAEYKTCIGG